MVNMTRIKIIVIIAGYTDVKAIIIQRSITLMYFHKLSEFNNNGDENAWK